MGIRALLTRVFAFAFLSSTIAFATTISVDFVGAVVLTAHLFRWAPRILRV